jgi:ribonucleotide reductase alpha subunit
MRVALGTYKHDVREALHNYKLVSEGYFTHATPTMFNVGTQHEQAFSCFLMQIQEDSIRGIYKTLTDCALISKWAGGIGLSIHKVRSKGSTIRGTQGKSNGIIPMLKNYNETARYVDQGGGKRNGSIAIFLEPWHADIMGMLMLRRSTGAESERARDLFYSIWIPDLFMKRVEANADWTLMCPDECPGLHECYGDDFEKLYEEYERKGMGSKTVKAQDIWKTILESQIETGTPYIGYKDAINRKSNQKNLGTIQSSNLCHEICEYTSPDEVAVCCLVSVSLSRFLDPSPFSKYGKANPGAIHIYGKSNCKRCMHAKNILNNHGIKYTYIDLDSMPLSTREATIEKLITAGAQTVTTNTTEPSHNNSKLECDGDKCQLVLSNQTNTDTPNTNNTNTNHTRPSIMLPVITIFTPSTPSEQSTTPSNPIKATSDESDISNEHKTANDEDNAPKTTTDSDATKTTTDSDADDLDNKMVEQLIGGVDDLDHKLLPVYNYEHLREVTKMTVRNLNKLIDNNYYPIPETETSNRRHRPIGVGVQGLADVFAMMKIQFDSDEAIAVNAKIAEHMYFAACEASMEIARKRKLPVQQYRRLLKRQSKGEQLTDEEITTLTTLRDQHFIYPDEVEKLPMSLAGAYSSFIGSPAYEGKLQYDLWDKEPSPELAEDWEKLKLDIKKHGMRNSLLMARMPTASTAQILGNNACMEPYLNNVFSRKTLAGNFTVLNKHLVRELLELGLWNNNIRERIILANGSVQDIMEIPAAMRVRYKTVWEMKQKWIVNHAVAVAPFICQTQSMNLFIAVPTFSILNKMQFYIWRQGLKTGVYYTRSRAKAMAQKFAVDANSGSDNKAAISQHQVSDAKSKANGQANGQANVQANGQTNRQTNVQNEKHIIAMLAAEQDTSDTCESCAG